MPLRGRQRVEVVLLAPLEEFCRLPLHVSAGVGELDRVGAAVARVASAADVALLLELVDEADHGRAVDGEDVGEGLLRDGPSSLSTASTP